MTDPNHATDPENTPYSVLLVEDSKADSGLIKSFLDDYEELNFLGCAETLKDGLVRSKDAEIILLDLSLPDSQRENTVASIREFGDKPVVVVTKERDTFAMYQAGYHGACGYVLKEGIVGNAYQAFAEQLVHTMFCAIGYAKKRRENRARARKAIQEIEANP